MACLLGCSTGVSNRNADHLDTSGYPPDIQEAYEVFAVRCSRCHTLARPLNARITDERHWVRYVARMRRQPGSGINRNNADLILKFLLFYTAQVRYEESGGEPGTLPGLVPEEPAPDPGTPGAAEPSQAPLPASGDTLDGERGNGGPSQVDGSKDLSDPALDGAGREP